MTEFDEILVVIDNVSTKNEILLQQKKQTLQQQMLQVLLQ